MIPFAVRENESSQPIPSKTNINYRLKIRNTVSAVLSVKKVTLKPLLVPLFRVRDIKYILLLEAIKIDLPQKIINNRDKTETEIIKILHKKTR